MDELLGRKKNKLEENNKYSEVQMRGYEIGVELLKCCRISREYGLLAMEETAKKEDMNAFLLFCIQFLLNGMRIGMSKEQIFELLKNYAQAETDVHNTQMIVKVLEAIAAGENEVCLKEVVASYLGRSYREKLIDNVAFSVERENILAAYKDKEGSTVLLEELIICTDGQIQLLLKNINNDTLVHALSGASGAVCRKFLNNLSDRLLYFVDMDIQHFQGTEEAVIEAQRRLLEKGVELKMIIP